MMACSGVNIAARLEGLAEGGGIWGGGPRALQFDEPRVALVMSRAEAFEIDTEEDWLMAVSMYEALRG